MQIKNQWNLADLVYHGRQLEAAALRNAEECWYITVFHAADWLVRYRDLTMGSKPASGDDESSFFIV